MIRTKQPSEPFNRFDLDSERRRLFHWIDQIVAQALMRSFGVIVSQIEQIGEMLFDLSAPGDDEHPINWAHVGTINEVNNRLSSVVAFLDRTET